MESRKRMDKFQGTDTLAPWNARSVLAAMVNRLDEGTGKVLQAIEDLGLKDNYICSTIDLFPTILDLAGLETRELSIDGKSFAGVL